MGLSVIPISSILQDNESFFLKLDKGALGGAFRYAQRLNGFIHRQSYVAVVAAVVADVQLKPDFDSGP